MARLTKRLLDIAGSASAIVVLLPVMAIVAIAVRIRLGSPIFYRQERIGQHGASLMVTKFRTMTDERNASGTPLPDEVRLGRFGKVVRRYSLDELPGLFAVLRGEMSLVGPRPLVARYRDRYSAEQWRRHEMKPGLAGWTQVNGRNALTWPEKFELDVW